MPLPSGKRPTLHYTQLPPMRQDCVLYNDWQHYLRELPRLLAEGYEGKFLVFKNGAILGPYETDDQAMDAAHAHYPLQAFLVQQVLEYHPVYSVPRAA